MRYIVYGSAILAALLIATSASGHLPRVATASNTQSDDTLNVRNVEGTIVIDARSRIYTEFQRRSDLLTGCPVDT